MKTYLFLATTLLLIGCNQTDTNYDAASNSASPISVGVPFTQENFLQNAWSENQTAELLDKTMRIKFSYNDTGLSENERAAVKELLLAGERMHSIYIDQVHPHAREYEALLSGQQKRTDIKELFRIMKGPIATTLDNKRINYFQSKLKTANENVYPQGVSREELDAFMLENPERKDSILHLRSVVKKATQSNIDEVLRTLVERPSLNVLHPGLTERVQNATGYFSVPYSVAYADDIFYIYDRLNAAANHMKVEDPAFAKYLTLRARDLLADDYDGGDATWVTANFKGNLNAQIGSYETYDDSLFGVKSYFSLSLLQKDSKKSAELAGGISDIQSIEDALPYDSKKRVRNNIPVGVYNVIADFGQARGTNTATILPNESHLSRQFGRTILIRASVLSNENIFNESNSAFKAATAKIHHNDMALEGNLYRTLWHEIGHYLGPDQTKFGGDIDAALQINADLIEEMKSDLISLFSAKRLHANGAYSDEQLRSIYASGISRVLQKNKPRRAQAYGTMKLIQMNWYLDRKLLTFENGKLYIDYTRYDEAVESLLSEVLNIQHQGNAQATEAFVVKWTKWDDKLHGFIGDAMKASETSRYRLVTYEALGE